MQDTEISQQLEQRATDLARAINNPATLARKLRESLVEIVGPAAAVAWHISGAYDNGKANFQILRLTPSLVARLNANEHGADLTMAWRKTTISGWQIAVGATVHARGLKVPKSSDIMAEFSVTITK